MHSALSALDSMDTQHSVPLTLQALSAECEHRVWSHAVIPDDLGPRLRVDLPVTLKSDPGPPAGRRGRVRGQKLLSPKKIVKITAGEILVKPSEGGWHWVQRRQGGEGGTGGVQRRDSGGAGVNTAAARASRRV